MIRNSIYIELKKAAKDRSIWQTIKMWPS